MSSSNYFSKIHIWRILAFCLVALVSTASVLATVTVARAAILAAPLISVTKSDIIIDDGVPLAEVADGRADPGETIAYTVVINNSGTDATGLTYTDTIDPNTTLSGSASVSPVAINDTLPVTVTGNVAINTALMATPFSVITNDYPGQNMSPGLTILGPATFLSAQGGNVTMTLSGAGIGQFTYDPPAGFEGTDTFTYALSDNANASSAVSNRTASVSITVSGMIWFVNNNALACTVDGCGRLSNPYSTLAAFSSANNGTGNHPAANDNIFVYESAAPYTGGITLLSGQKLIGQDSTQTLSAITGLSPVTGSLTLPAMNATPAQSTAIQNAGGNGVTLTTGNTLNGFTGGNASASAIFGSGFGTLTAADVTVNSNGQALSLTNGALSATFPSVTSTGGTNNVALTGPLTGTLTISAGALSGAAGNAFNMNGGSATINNAATIASGSARSVNVTGLTGGTVTFSGAITDTDTGISLSTNTGATINFTGALTLSTGTNTAFNATGGGTISATNTTSTATTTTATAVNVASTTIGANNLNFRSVSSSGGSATGIILTSTGSTGSLVVTGDGTTTKGGNGSGGTITNKTGGADGNGATSSGVYINNASAILRNMTLTRFDNYGVYGLGVNSVTVQYSTIGAISGAACADGDGDIGTSSGSGDAALVFGISNPSGSNGFTSGGTLLLDNLNVYCSIEHQVEIYQQSGSFTATISNSDIKDASTLFGGDGVQTEMQGTASAVIAVDNVSFDDNKSQAVQAAANDSSTLDMTVKDSDIVRSSQGNEGIIMSNGSNGDLIAHIIGNNISGVQGATIFVGQTPGNASASSSLTAYIANNIINHPTSAVNSAILVWTTSTAGAGAPANVMVTNNTITQNSTQGVARGIFVDTPDAGTNPNFSVTVTSNIVHIQDNSAGLQGIVVQGRQSSNACFDVRSNTVDFPAGVPAGINGIRIRQSNTATVNLEQGASAGAPATVLAANNTATAESVGTVGVVGNSTCANPPVAVSPNRTGTIAQAQPNTSIDAQAVVSVAPVLIEKLASNGALGSVMKHDVPARSIAANVSANPGGGKPLFALVQPAPALSGETVTLNIGTLPAGKSVTITFRATVDALDSGEIRTRILNQGTVSGSNFTSLTTTDPSPNADPFCTASPSIGAQTCTPVDRPNTTVVSLTRQSANPNKNASVTWQIVFADAVDGLTASNFSLVSGGSVTGAVLSLPTETSGPPSTTWNITATTGTGDGTLELRMANDTGLSHDVTNQPYTQPASGAEYTIDKTAPAVTGVTYNGNTGCLGSSPYYCNAGDTVQINVAFNEMVSVNTVGGTPSLALNSGEAASYVSGSGTNILVFEYTVGAGENASDLDYTSTSALALNSGTIQDTATNNATLSLASPGASGSLGDDEDVVIDTIAPVATNFNRLTPSTTPTNVDALIWQAVFSESVTGVNADGSDFTVPALTGETISVSPVNATTYDVTVSGGDLPGFNGLVDLNFDSPTINDLAGNALSNTTVGFDQHYVMDNTIPMVTINKAVGQVDPTNSGPINFTVIFSESIGSSFTTGDVDLSASTTPGTLIGTVSETAPNDGTTFNVAVTGMTGNGDVIAAIAAGVASDGVNINSASTTVSDNSVAYDTSVPTVTINKDSGQADPTGTSPINFTVAFSESVSDFDDSADVILSGTAGGPLSAVISGGPTVYNVAVSGMSSDGTVIADIQAGAATDGANLSAASTSTDNSVLYDTVAPSVAVNQAVGQADPANASPISFTVVFTEAVTGFDDAADLNITGTATGTLTGVITGGPTSYNVAISGMTSAGTVILDIPASAAVDGGGNPNSPATFTDHTVTYVPPTDLTITKTDGVTTATPGGSVTYTITASNAGSNADPAATVTDTFPASLTGTWTCVGAGGGTCTAAGSGNINDTVNLPVGGSVTYTVSATISPAATGSLSNIATVATSSGVVDTTPSNNSATDTDTLAPQADLAITKTDGVTTATPGGSVTYTITASNAGPSNAPGSTVADTFPASLTANWTCVGAGGGTCTAAGSGNINDTVNLPAGGSVTYTVSATISPSATGTLSNTATVAASVTDPSPANNSATDSDTLVPQADLSITKTDGSTVAVVGNALTYTITASNAGPSNAPGSTVTDTFPADLTGVTWTCVGAGGGTCAAAGSSDINDTVNLPVGGSVTYTANATVSLAATGTLSNTATVSAPGGVTDPSPANNSATDSDTIAPPVEVTINKSGAQADPTSGATINFTVVFDSAVTGFDDADVTLGGVAGATTATVTGGPTTYNVAVTGMTGDGTVIASLAAGVATGSQGEPNAESTSIDNSVFYDATAPDTTITNDPAPSGFTNVDSISFNFTGDDGTGVGGLTFECNLDGGGFSACTSPANYPGPLADGPHTFSVRAQDSLGNTDPSPDSYAWTVDTVEPTATLTTLVGSATNTSPILVTITFSEPVSIGTGVGDLNITNSPADPTILGGPTVYTFSLTPIAQGPVTVQYLQDGANDAAGNLNIASNTLSVTYDTVAPTVTINQASGQVDPTGSSPVNFTAVFSEPVTGFGQADVLISGISGTPIVTVTGTGPTYTVSVSGMVNGETVTASIPSNAAQDLASNASAVSTSTDNSVTYNGTDTVFADVPATYWARLWIERLYHAGVTGGCGTSPLIYCPNNAVSRAQMAVLLLKSIHGSSYLPPVATGTIFNDVPVTHPQAGWIEQLYADGITLGCGGGNYCPGSSVSRAQMALFLLRAKYGSAYTPPAPTGTIFSDVPATHPQAAWIEQLYVEGITTGCDAGIYCPSLPTTRAQMAVFLVRTFNLP